MFKRKQGTCTGCGVDRLIYSKKMCQNCYLKSRQKVYAERRKDKIAKGDTINKDKLHEFFKEYWDENKKRVCYECNTPLFTYNAWHIHHLIQKRFYKQYLPIDIVFNKENLVYVCLGCHSDADHNQMKNTPKIKELYNKLKEKLDNGSI